jgi:Tfp pilus assembly protein PilN
MALVFVGTLIVGLVVVGVFWQIWSNDVKRLQKEWDRQKAEQARLAAIQAENQRYLAEIKDLETRKNTTQMLLNSRIGPVELMTALGNTVNRTNDLYLLTVTPTGGRLTIRGQSNTVESIARFIAALKESGSFDDVQLQRYYQDDLYNRLSFKFDLDCVFKSPTAAAPAPGVQPAATSKAARRAGM